MHELGLTRSRSTREYLLHTPDTFVRTTLPGLTGGMAIVHIGPQHGADFAMSTVEFEDGGRLLAGPAQRFLYVLEGQVVLSRDGMDAELVLGPAEFCFVPQEDLTACVARGKTRVCLTEKPYTGPDDLHPVSPHFLHGREADVTPVALNGDSDLQVRCLLPSSPAFDFAVNTMTYTPGASLAQVEVHYMEHGLLMLEGGGVYRLGEHWHPVQTGDVIWMAPFCPQWFAAVGKTPAKYLIYKDVNRHVLA